jgi:predicted amidohydrolase
MSQMGSDEARVTVAAAQFAPRPGDVRWNISRALELVSQAGVAGVDLVVLPELVTTGYYMFDRFKQLAEPMDGPTVTILGELAKRYDLQVVLGMAERGIDGDVHDSAVLVAPSGLAGVYRKMHLWDTEKDVFTPGTDVVVKDTGGPLGLLGLLVCYDLEFPETAEEVGATGASLLAAPAAFGNLTLWRATLEARARDLGIPIVAANRLGSEVDTEFCGHSMVMDADGSILADAGTEPGLAVAEVVVDPSGKGRDRRDPRLIHPEFG